MHDAIDRTAELPAYVSLSYDPVLLERSYRISRQLWDDVAPGSLAALALRFATGRIPASADLQAFKDIRARAKQLRFAYATLGEGHCYPRRLDRLTRMMGKIQDAVKTRNRVGAAARGLLLWFLASSLSSAANVRELERLHVTSPERLEAHIHSEVARIATIFDAPALTNKTFHNTRKIISRLVAFYDTLTVIAPAAMHREIDRYLSTINGLMGSMHDDMVVRKAGRRRDYSHKLEPLQDEIAIRLRQLVEVFGRS